MTKCDRCGKEVGKLFCAKCRGEIEGITKFVVPANTKKLIPLLFWDPEKKHYIFGCTVKGCPCNRNGLCGTRHLTLPKNVLHEFDGDNIIQQVCG